MQHDPPPRQAQRQLRCARLAVAAARIARCRGARPDAPSRHRSAQPAAAADCRWRWQPGHPSVQISPADHAVAVASVPAYTVLIRIASSGLQQCQGLARPGVTRPGVTRHALHNTPLQPNTAESPLSIKRINKIFNAEQQVAGASARAICTRQGKASAACAHQASTAPRTLQRLARCSDRPTLFPRRPVYVFVP